MGLSWISLYEWLEKLYSSLTYNPIRISCFILNCHILLFMPHRKIVFQMCRYYRLQTEEQQRNEVSSMYLSFIYTGEPHDLWYAYLVFLITKYVDFEKCELLLLQFQYLFNDKNGRATDSSVFIRIILCTAIILSIIMTWHFLYHPPSLDGIRCRGDWKMPLITCFAWQDIPSHYHVQWKAKSLQVFIPRLRPLINALSRWREQLNHLVKVFSCDEPRQTSASLCSVVQVGYFTR